MARALQVGAVLVLLFGTVTARVVISGEREIAGSTHALRRGDAQAATVHARRAAGWYAPGAPHVRVAYDRLRALARAAEEHRRFDIALLAWRGIRTASLESRWIAAPYRTDLELANEQIARLMAATPSAPAAPLEPDPAFLAEQLELLSRDESPRLPWVLALIGSFLVGSIGMVVWARETGRGMRRRTKGSGWTRVRWGAGAAAVGFVVWLLSVWRA